MAHLLKWFHSSEGSSEAAMLSAELQKEETVYLPLNLVAVSEEYSAIPSADEKWTYLSTFFHDRGGVAPLLDILKEESVSRRDITIALWLLEILGRSHTFRAKICFGSDALNDKGKPDDPDVPGIADIAVDVLRRHPFSDVIESTLRLLFSLTNEKSQSTNAVLSSPRLQRHLLLVLEMRSQAPKIAFEMIVVLLRRAATDVSRSQLDALVYQEVHVKLLHALESGPDIDLQFDMLHTLALLAKAYPGTIKSRGGAKVAIQYIRSPQPDVAAGAILLLLNIHRDKDDLGKLLLTHPHVVNDILKQITGEDLEPSGLFAFASHLLSMFSPPRGSFCLETALSGVELLEAATRHSRPLCTKLYYSGFIERVLQMLTFIHTNLLKHLTEVPVFFKELHKVTTFVLRGSEEAPSAEQKALVLESIKKALTLFDADVVSRELVEELHLFVANETAKISS